MESNEPYVASAEKTSLTSNSSTDTLVTPLLGVAGAALAAITPETQEGESLCDTKPTPLSKLVSEVQEKIGSDAYIRTTDYGIYELVEEVHPLWITNVNVSRHYEAIKVSSYPICLVFDLGDRRD